MHGPCPRCGSALSDRTFGSVTLEGCATCGGLWFDHQELTRLTRDPSVGLMAVERAFSQALAGYDGSGEMRCPRCAVALYAFSFPHTPGVMLDACPQCKGIWLDDGELQAIHERIQAARAQAAAPVADIVETQRERLREAASFLLSVPCSACQTSNPASSLVCWTCGAALKSRSVLELCPRCDRPLQEAHYGATGTRVDVCPACTGVWFEAGELPIFLRLTPQEVRGIQQALGTGRIVHPDADTRTARCPGCQYVMERRGFAGERALRIDLCPQCKSVWLDAGELLAAHAHLQRGGFFSLAPGEADPWGRG